jgi:large subunit ribosomal protein L31
MKNGIHPQSFAIDARCVCGATFPVLSTKQEIVVSFCSQCHPFYTNKQQFADVEGRIEKFNKKFKVKQK